MRKKSIFSVVALLGLFYSLTSIAQLPALPDSISPFRQLAGDRREQPLLTGPL